jgi:hypothetical protein
MSNPEAFGVPADIQLERETMMKAVGYDLAAVMYQNDVTDNIYNKRYGALRDVKPPLDMYESTLQEEGRATPAVAEALEKAKEVYTSTGYRFYIAGGLTGVDEATKLRYEQTSDIIAAGIPNARRIAPASPYAPHLHGTDPIKHPNVTPEEVHDIDFLWAAVVATAHVNFLHPVAHGNAIEMSWAERYNIPTINVVPEGFTASRLVRGMRNIVGQLVYKDFEEDGLPQVQALMTGIGQAIDKDA